MAIVQYMTGRAKSEILRHNLSVALRGFSSQVAGISGTVSIWYTTDASLPDLNSPNYNSIVATLDANGKVATTNGTWTEMTRPGRGDARFTLTSTIFNEIYLNGWQALTEAEYSGATHVAIVIGFESMTAAQYVEFQNITMCPGDLATVSPATSSYEETQNCYQFYETSYVSTVAPGAATSQGIIVFSPNMNTSVSFQVPEFSYLWKAFKYKNPNVTLYSPTGTADRIQAEILRYGTNRAGPTDLNTSGLTISANQQGFLAKPNTSIGQAGAAADNDNYPVVRYHYVADSRLGIV